MTSAADAVRGRAHLRLWLLLAIYALVSVGVLFTWSARGVYAVTGDEPHYLLMAKSLVTTGSLEMTQPYLDEFTRPMLYAPGLAPPGSEPHSPYAHVFDGPNGRYSWHGPGVPFLLALPLAFGGVLLAKLAMVALGGLAVVLAWRISGLTLPDGWLRVAWLLMSVDRARTRWSLLGYGFLVGYLPWLGIKFLPASAGLAVISGVALFRRARSDAGWLALPVVVSYLLLLITNMIWFGSFAGPPSDGALEASATAAMVTWGLLMDQDQGILLQNPALWLGLLGLIPFLRRWRWAGLGWAVALVAIWLPGGMHTGWYGLGGFVGRYSWALAILFIAPALVGADVLRAWSVRVARLVLAVAIAINAAFLALHTFTGGSSPGRVLGIDLYTKDPGTWLESYAAFWYPVQDWMPALYDTSWAFGFLPNWAWLVVVGGVVIAGVRAKAGLLVAGAGLVLVVVAGLVSSPGSRADVMASGLSTARDGYVDAGIVRQMRWGPYTWSVQYSSALPPESVAGRWEIASAGTEDIVASGELRGTAGVSTLVPVEVPYRSLQPREFVLRVASYGGGEMTLESLGVAHGTQAAQIATP